MYIRHAYDEFAALSLAMTIVIYDFINEKKHSTRHSLRFIALDSLAANTIFYLFTICRFCAYAGSY